MKKDIILYRNNRVKFTKNLKILGKEVSNNPEVDYGLLNNYSPSRGNLYNVIDQGTRFEEKKEHYYFDASLFHQLVDQPCHKQIDLPMNFTTKTVRDRVSVSQQIAELLQCSNYCLTHCQIGVHPELERLDVWNGDGCHQRFYGDATGIESYKKVRKQLHLLGVEPYKQIHELKNHLIAIRDGKWMYGDISEFALPFNKIPKDFDYIYFPLEVIRSGYLLNHKEIQLLLGTESITVQLLNEDPSQPILRLVESESDENNSILDEIIIDAGYDTSRFDGLLYTSTFLMHILGMETLFYPEDPIMIRIEVRLLNDQVLQKTIKSKDFKPFSLLEEVLKLLEKQLEYNMRYL